MREKRTRGPWTVEDYLKRYMPKTQDRSVCWLWRGRLNSGGYGRIEVRTEGRRGRGKNFGAHVAAYEKFRGPVPKDRQLDHLCRQRMCVNPWHLEIVTQRVNILRGNGWGGRNARKTHCTKGHEFTEANAYIRIVKGQRHRRCRICLLDWQNNSEKGKAIRARTVAKRKAQDTRSVEERKRATAEGRASYCASITHCPKGHLYDEKNTYRNAKGHRTCRKCRADRQLASYRARVTR